MGGEKQTQQGSSQVTATPEERELERLQLDRIKANQGNQQILDQNLYNTINTVLQGGTLPSNLAGVTGINEQQTQSMVNQSLRDIAPQFQQAGILDSGAAAQISANTAAGVRNQNAQFNVTALQQLLNQALGGGSNLQANANSSNQVLGSQLAGLRSSSYSGSTIGMNPFMKSFQQSFGTSLGKGQFGGTQFTGGSGSGSLFGAIPPIA